MTLRNGTTEDGKLVRGYQLISTNIFRKFSGLLDLPATWLSTSVRGLNCFLTTNPIDARIAMTYHKSQFVRSRTGGDVFCNTQSIHVCKYTRRDCRR